MISAGQRQHIVEFQKNDRIKKTSGERVDNFLTVARAFGKIRPVKMDRQSEESAEYQVSTFEVDVLFSHQLAKLVDTNFRLVISGKNYSIDAIDDLFSRKKITYSVSLYE